MMDLRNEPTFIFVVSLGTLWLSARLGALLARKRWMAESGARDDLNIVLAGTLTMLGLIIGFTFSMAITRYDQRKSLEEAEANAIGTEYVRADFLPGADAAKVKGLLIDYLHQRILFYSTHDAERLRPVRRETARLQEDLWSSVRSAAATQPVALVALGVTGMNDVLNSEGYTQAAFWNRIPFAAWGLMGLMAICSNVLVGLSMRRTEAAGLLLFVLPLVVATAFFLIADIDSPGGGVVRVHPENLLSLAESLGRR